MGEVELEKSPSPGREKSIAREKKKNEKGEHVFPPPAKGGEKKRTGTG